MAFDLRHKYLGLVRKRPTHVYLPAASNREIVNHFRFVISPKSLPSFKFKDGINEAFVRAVPYFGGWCPPLGCVHRLLLL